MFSAEYDAAIFEFIVMLTFVLLDYVKASSVTLWVFDFLEGV
tara:strand:- start:172 stop:297 length:126 start_codon:yes stop_codon:yes gene_type:complete